MTASAIKQSSFSVLTENKVARNAFGLLALSMIPTALGAWLGMVLGVPVMMAASPLIYTLVFLGVAFGMLFAINSSANSAAAIPLMLLFTAFMGVALSGMLSTALSVADGTSIIMLAALGTAAITSGCAAYAATTKRDFSGIGGFLFGSVIALIVVGLVNIWFKMTVLSLLISAVAIVVFSAFMVFDVQRVIKGGETNYVLAAVSIYLNIYNIFSSLLNILLSFSSSSE